MLPIDAHKERIMAHIAAERVTIIHGETGCGKSSRVPVWLTMADRSARMFVSQPRRIAATALVRRVEASIGGVVGLRMGQGVREETKQTRLMYCTAGYVWGGAGAGG